MGLTDLARISSWFWNLGDVALFDRTLPVPVNPDTLQESWRTALTYSDPPRAYWFVAEDAEGEPLGIGGLQGINYIHGDAVLPMFVVERARRQGLATAIAARMMDMAFNRLRLHRVTTFYRQDNAATQHVLAKIGFVDEGRQREGWFVDGQRLDVIQAGILASEWADLSPQVAERLSKPGKAKLTFMGESSL